MAIFDGYVADYQRVVADISALVVGMSSVNFVCLIGWDVKACHFSISKQPSLINTTPFGPLKLIDRGINSNDLTAT